MTKEQILKHYWGFDEFRSQQATIIDAVLKNQDVLALLPTGGGKSICYQLPAMMMDGLCLVISPLVSLIEDQVTSLNQKGIKAIGLKGGISASELDQLLDNCIYGSYKFLYLSPERLNQSIVWERIQKMNINLIAIDEAHCISQWGHDFRPSYLNCTGLKASLNKAVIALTATATPQVEEELITLLGIQSPLIAKDSFKRTNLTYQLINTEDKINYMIRLCQYHQGSGIIYANNRGLCKQITERLNQQNISAATYHGGMKKEEKTKVLHKWKSNTSRIVVATSAFGMGIDKADVRFIIHYQLTESIEQYYQETGRAGRDGKKAYTYVLFNRTDEQLLKDQYLHQYPSLEELKTVYKHLNNFFSVAYGELPLKPFSLDLQAFCLRYHLKVTKTYYALKILDKHQVIALQLKSSIQTKVQFKASKESFEEFMRKEPSQSKMLQLILRTYGGIFELPTAVNTDHIANLTQSTSEHIIKTLRRYEQLELISLEEQSSDVQLSYSVPREDHYTINKLSSQHQQSIALKYEKLQACINYARLQKGCRMSYLMQYFGEKASNCNNCDLCFLESFSSSTINLQQEIVKLLQDAPLDSKAICLRLNLPENSIFEALKELLATNSISINASNHYQLKH